MGNTNGEWVSVDDRLPKENQSIIVFDCYDAGRMVYTMCCTSYFMACISGDEFSEDYRGITHWMPLPEPPQQ